jgi:uncharacterized protein
MKYRKFGKLDWEGSALGFGTMRLPRNGPAEGDVDEKEAIKMIRHAIDKGVNYIDTAYPYHAGKSETILGKALKDGYRQKVKIATKMPSWMISKKSDFDFYFEEQLDRLQTRKIDFYLLHNMNKHFWPNLRDLKVLDWCDKKMADGHIGKMGFSFHDEYKVFKEVVDAYDSWTFAQIQYNYMDTNYQAGTRGMRYAADKGMGVVIMEPLQGGALAKKPPEGVAKIWAESKVKRSPAEWSLMWLWEQPEVSLVLSGMSAMDQLVENLEIAGRSGPGVLKEDEMALIKRARKVFEGMSPIPCTNCGYCMPCINGVEIPKIFQLYNNGILYDDMKTSRHLYYNPPGLHDGQRVDECKECDRCAELCPQKIPIPQMLKKVHAEFSKK